MRDDLQKLDIAIEEFIKKYKKDSIHEEPYEMYIRKREVFCNDISKMKKLVSNLGKEFSKSECNCKDEEIQKLFTRYKNIFFGMDDTDEKRKRRFEEYMSLIRFWSRDDLHPYIQERLINSLKLFEKMREMIATFIK